MRRAWLLGIIAAGCGRLYFEPLATREVDAGVDSGTDNGADGGSQPGFSHVIARRHHTCALYEGVAYCWGNNGTGQLGDGTTMNRDVPTAVALPAGVIQELVTGEYSSCAIVDATLYCWGEMFQPTPAEVTLPAPVTSVALGKDFICAIADATYCWGTNDRGQLGDGTNAPRANPTPVQGAAHTRLYAGEDHTCALKVSGGAECWGHNDDGVLGFGAFLPANALLPQPVDPSITTLPSIGATSACAVENNIVMCWGSNDWGELGDGTGTPSAVPRVVPGHPPASTVTSGGSPNTMDASCTVDLVGDVRCWGRGDFGRLGNGDTMTSPTPVDVDGLPGPARLTAIGEAHACAALVDGDLWCWGRGNSGQLGDGASSSSLAPVRVIPPS